MNLWKTIAFLWSTPSAFRADWRRYALNQSGHWGAVGVLPALIFGPLVVPVVAFFYALWELSQWQWRRASASDCVEDFTFVVLGLSFGATLSPDYLGIAAMLLVAGIFWRVEEAQR